jgi:hypothetical protein
MKVLKSFGAAFFLSFLMASVLAYPGSAATPAPDLEEGFIQVKDAGACMDLLTAIQASDLTNVMSPGWFSGNTGCETAPFIQMPPEGSVVFRYQIDRSYLNKSQIKGNDVMSIDQCYAAQKAILGLTGTTYLNGDGSYRVDPSCIVKYGQATLTLVLPSQKN